MLADKAVVEAMVRLGPWHFDVEVRPGLSTSLARDAPDSTGRSATGAVSFVSPGEKFRAGLLRVYPGGMAGRSVLDCACNCGAYLFWAKELGAGRGFGFDVREHWIAQARFLLQHRTFPKRELRFEVLDLYDLGRHSRRPFDVTFFNGIFYHLPDPVHGLRIAADLTRELLVVDTATHEGEADGMLRIGAEGPEGHRALMSGVHGLNWFPTGPDVLVKILAWLGFSEVRILFHQSSTPFQPPTMGRIMLIAARSKSVLEHYDAVEAASHLHSG